MAKDRTKRPLATWGAAEPWRQYAGMTVDTAPKQTRSEAKKRIAQKFAASDANKVIPMTAKMRDTLELAHQMMDHFDPWAVNFVVSLIEFSAKTGGLTQKQWHKLQEVLTR